jgi:putative endonuclease
MNIGKYGEEMALKHLEAKGLELVKGNYKFDRAEIDLILKDDKNKVLVFTEVKSRRSNKFVDAEDSVAELKQNQIWKAAEGFLSENEEFEDYEKRFDIISVYINGGNADVKHFENVF